jgi:hypothetical protein
MGRLSVLQVSRSKHLHRHVSSSGLVMLTRRGAAFVNRVLCLTITEQPSLSVPEELENWHRWVTDEETSIKALDLRYFAIVHFDHENRLPTHPRAKRLIRRKPTF